MQKVAVWISPLIAIFVAIFLVVFFIQINKSGPIVSDFDLDSGTKEVDTPLKESSYWLKHFSKSEKVGTFFPVTEVNLSFDLEKKITRQKVYKLSATVIDPYQLFCLKQELSQRNIQYYFKKERSNSELLVFSKNRDKLQQLLVALQEYKIEAKLIPYKEEAQWKSIR